MLAAFLVIIVTIFTVLFSSLPQYAELIRPVISISVTVVDVSPNNSILNGSIVSIKPVSDTSNSAENKTGRYVSMCAGNFDSRRIGNQLFNFAAMLYVARLTGRRVAMVRRHPYGWLDQWFEVSVTRVDNIGKELCPCVGVGEGGNLAFHAPLQKLHKRTNIVGKSLLICGFFQSWKYTVGIESELRYHLRLIPNVSAAVDSYMEHIRPLAWKGQSFRRIGIHIRAGDVLSRRDKWDFGYTVPQRPYFEKAMSRFLNESQGGPVQFIVTTDSLKWVKKAINFTSIADQLNRTSTKNKVDVNVVYSEGHDAGFDLAVLSVCDGVIMSTGTYGWWGAWLANKTTIYYSNWPRQGTALFSHFNRKDFFPPNWIPIGGPWFPCCQS